LLLVLVDLSLYVLLRLGQRRKRGFGVLVVPEEGLGLSYDGFADSFSGLIAEPWR
jgi:hypothetical protein